MDQKNNIYVTRPSLPDLSEFTKYLEEIWERKWLTNNGVFHQELEKKLADYLGVPYLSLFSNGTLALMTAMQALGIKGEVITTPFSFVATTHAMLWNNISPVFCDVDPVFGNIDPSKIEALISDKTSAIVPVHVYGNPVEVEQIQEIADKHGLKVIYDAAHAFGVTKNGGSILNYGDLSILSFHATKVFNTIEGGAIVCQDEQTKLKIDQLKNFGFVNETTVVEAGINAKMNELQAAFGLLQLESIAIEIGKRKKVAEAYRDLLKGVRGIRLFEDIPGVEHNYSYFTIFVDQDYPLTRDELYEKLKMQNIFGRRYFYPLISDFSMYKDLPSNNVNNLKEAIKIAEQVICLPMYSDLIDVQRITDVICN